MTELNFDSNVIEPMGRFTPIPLDDYLVMITASEMKDTKPSPNKEPGKYLNITFEVIEGEFKGRRIFDTLNLVNANTQTVEIAQRRLSSICRSVGVLHPKDSAELHNLPLVVSVGIKAADGQYEAKNVIRGFSRTDGKELKDVVADAPAAKVAPVAAAASPAAGKNLKPWQKSR